ncbi:MAG: Planctomycete cytochrome [Chthoniobacteraceae bacterium]|nr:Planctomycete cytochrome [Chthoniobacteraceae bacterium]
MNPRGFFLGLAPFLFGPITAIAADKTPIAIAAVTRAEPVDFARDLIPFLNENCLACHSKTSAKAGLNMETPELLLKGGDSGPAIVPGHADDSLALQAAAHLDSDLLMPPRDNKARARDLTSEQLGLFKLWIDQGAKPSKKIERVLQWQPLPEGLRAIFAVAMSADGQFGACARGNRVSIYHLPSGRLIANETANRDQINALAFNPEGTLLAAAGYREVKLFNLIKSSPECAFPEVGDTVTVSPGGKWMAASGSDGNVKILEAANGTVVRSFKAAAGPISAMEFSQDETKLACGSQDKSLLIWNVADGAAVAKAETPAAVTALAWLGDSNQQIASGGADNVIRVWNETLAPLKELAGHTAPITTLSRIGGGAGQLVSASSDGSARIWDVEKAQSLLQITHGAPVTSMAVRPDGKRVATAGNGVIKLWDRSGKQVGEMQGNRYAKELAEARDRRLQIAVRDAAYRKEVVQNSEKLLQTSRDRVKKAEEAVPPRQKEVEAKQKELKEAGDAKIAAEQSLADADVELKKAADAFELAEKTAQQAKNDAETLKGATPPDQPAIDKALAESGARLQEAAKAKAERDQRTAQRKQAADKIEPAAKKYAAAGDAVGKSQQVAEVAANELVLGRAEEQKFSAALAQAKAAVDTAEIARVKADDALQTARKTVAEAALPVLAVTFSPDNQMIATAGEDRLIHTWSAETGTPFDVLDGSNAAVATLAFTPGGVLISGLRDQSVKSWNVRAQWKAGSVIGSVESPFADRVCALAFSPDGKLLATGGGEPSRGGEIKIWNTATGEMIKDLPNVHTDTVLALEFSPDGASIASGAADKIARVVDLESGKVTRAFEGHSHHVLSVSWSLDGRTLVTGGADNVVKVWDVPTGERKKNIEGYDKEITSVRFVGVGDQVLTGSGDPKVRLVATDGKEIRSFPDAVDFIQGVAATADGKLVMAGGQDGVLRVWMAADGQRVQAFPASAD